MYNIDTKRLSFCNFHLYIIYHSKVSYLENCHVTARGRWWWRWWGRWWRRSVFRWRGWWCCIRQHHRESIIHNHLLINSNRCICSGVLFMAIEHVPAMSMVTVSIAVFMVAVVMVAVVVTVSMPCFAVSTVGGGCAVTTVLTITRTRYTNSLFV